MHQFRFKNPVSAHRLLQPNGGKLSDRRIRKTFVTLLYTAPVNDDNEPEIKARLHRRWLF